MAERYHIRVKGHLDPSWSVWFDDLTITNEANGDAVIAGPIVDQAALHGVLIKVRDLGLTLLGVSLVAADGAVANPHAPNLQGVTDEHEHIERGNNDTADRHAAT